MFYIAIAHPFVKPGEYLYLQGFTEDDILTGPEKKAAIVFTSEKEAQKVRRRIVKTEKYIATVVK